MTATEELRTMKLDAQKALRKAEKAYCEYANSCWRNSERKKAFAIYKNIQNAERVHK